MNGLRAGHDALTLFHHLTYTTDNLAGSQLGKSVAAVFIVRAEAE
jgi:hypothetical protein